MMNKVALITGGSRGIGKAISERFGKEGYSIIINYKENTSRVEQLKLIVIQISNALFMYKNKQN